ncbi:TetR/AcrR family transcriptional regulator [Pseudoroseicyclus sp. H15]
MSSLREKNRRRSIDAIQRAAISLAEEVGFENVTTEAIAAAAGISPRTFFNYFPFKEAVFLPPSIEMPKEERENFCRGTGSVAEDLLTLIYSMAPVIPREREMLISCRQIAEQSPRLTAMNYDFLRELEKQLAELFRQRGGTVGGERAPLLAALTTAAIRSGFDRWIEEDGASPFTLICANIVELAPIYEGGRYDMSAAAE